MPCHTLPCLATDLGVSRNLLPKNVIITHQTQKKKPAPKASGNKKNHMTVFAWSRNAGTVRLWLKLSQTGRGMRSCWREGGSVRGSELRGILVSGFVCFGERCLTRLTMLKNLGLWKWTGGGKPVGGRGWKRVKEEKRCEMKMSSRGLEAWGRAEGSEGGSVPFFSPFIRSQSQRLFRLLRPHCGREPGAFDPFLFVGFFRLASHHLSLSKPGPQLAFLAWCWAWEWGWFGRKGAHRACVRHQWAVEGKGERMNWNGMQEMGFALRKEVREGAASEGWGNRIHPCPLLVESYVGNGRSWCSCDEILIIVGESSPSSCKTFFLCMWVGIGIVEKLELKKHGMRTPTLLFLQQVFQVFHVWAASRDERYEYTILRMAQFSEMWNMKQTRESVPGAQGFFFLRLYTNLIMKCGGFCGGEGKKKTLSPKQKTRHMQAINVIHPF